VETTITAGTPVYTSDNQHVGHVGYVVVDPNTFRVADLVVSTGNVLGRDIVVSVDQVARETEDGVYLRLDRQGLDACPDYVDVDYQAPPSTWLPSAGITYPAGTMLWPAGIAYPEATSVTVNTPEGTVGLHPGMDVISSDGHKVGSIDAMITDPESQDVTGVVVKHGFIFTHDTTIPISEVANVENDQVKLRVTRDQAEQEFRAAE
jgi:uncharacterized protein YrrD